ncbi:N-acetylmuramoyl-L-alanine amidase family 2 [Rhodomicrobium vannielii ATCC 17100]|uniref:N-acetylmuramoyl-L-alanine amidase family 2 n=1 Tax=Rhodomicrobium vannielii (strain ATCC 17100 / DSM 162 / LMG 4299 / NCIMB 10020 / ATH 3.1.1) TaxID=648757 RepID=E3HZZ5_RHOVT|nr:peptidoglycan recognition family protein [Rhodomicrobium vannielii]ADP69946.1 N-acetylmuramoyl-L-alanine amidase family 2 [Rhodomicrobium vannielii ATCC 17100]
MRALIFCAAVLAFSLAPPGNQAFADNPVPDIVPRAAWGAQSPNYALMHDQKPTEIIIHHTANRQQRRVSLEAKMRGLQEFAFKPGRVGFLAKTTWGDVPYHYYIDVSGRIGEGRDLSFAGDSVTALDNEDRIQVAVEGDFEREQPSQAEAESLTRLVTWLAASYGIPASAISGHGDFDQTNCPGKNLKPILEEIREAVRAIQAR